MVRFGRVKGSVLWYGEGKRVRVRVRFERVAGLGLWLYALKKR